MLILYQVKKYNSIQIPNTAHKYAHVNNYTPLLASQRRGVNYCYANETQPLREKILNTSKCSSTPSHSHIFYYYYLFFLLVEIFQVPILLPKKYAPCFLLNKPIYFIIIYTYYFFLPCDHDEKNH